MQSIHPAKYIANTSTNFKEGLQYQYFLVLLNQYGYFDRFVFNINHTAYHVA